jgi:deoxyribose-phosphate aldolase
VNPQIAELIEIGPTLEPTPFAAPEVSDDFARRLHGHLDVTSLDTRDSPLKVIIWARAARETPPGAEPVATVCVYPALVVAARMELEPTSIQVSTVAGGYPHGLSTMESAVSDIQSCAAMAVREIEIPVPLYMVFSQDWRALTAWVREMKKAASPCAVKVVLPASEIGDRRTIYRASLCCLDAGADFVVNAARGESGEVSLEQSEAIMQAVAVYREQTGRSRGFKAFGSVRTLQDAALYWGLACAVMGESELTAYSFRMGAAELLDEIRQRLMPA